MKDLWEALSGKQSEPVPMWVDGFVDGATAVWNEVAVKI